MANETILVLWQAASVTSTKIQFWLTIFTCQKGSVCACVRLTQHVIRHKICASACTPITTNRIKFLVIIHLTFAIGYDCLFHFKSVKTSQRWKCIRQTASGLMYKYKHCCTLHIAPTAILYKKESLVFFACSWGDLRSLNIWLLGQY